MFFLKSLNGHLQVMLYMSRSCSVKYTSLFAGTVAFALKCLLMAYSISPLEFCQAMHVHTYCSVRAHVIYVCTRKLCVQFF